MDGLGQFDNPAADSARSRALCRHHLSAHINPLWKCLVARVCASAVTAILLISSPHATPVDASEFDLQFGHWAGDLERDGHGKVVACTVSLHNAAKEMLLIRADQSSAVSMGVFDAEWGESEAAFIEVIIMVDHELIHAGRALVLEEDGIFLQASRKASLSAIGEGQYLSVTSGERNAVFDLEESDRAVEFLNRCEPKVSVSSYES